jgi:hypothetical protein
MTKHVVAAESLVQPNEYTISSGQHALSIAFTDAKSTGIDLKMFASEMYRSAEELLELVSSDNRNRGNNNVAMYEGIQIILGFARALSEEHDFDPHHDDEGLRA